MGDAKLTQKHVIVRSPPGLLDDENGSGLEYDGTARCVYISC